MTGRVLGSGSNQQRGAPMREIILRFPREKEDEAESMILIHRLDTGNRSRFDYYLEGPEGGNESALHLFAPESEMTALLSWINANAHALGPVTVREVEDRELTAYCQEYLEPYWLSESVLVDPFTRTEKEIILLRLVCGKAFGIGDHSTTRLAAQLLQKYLKRGQRVIDVGCGTGVLSILASKLGAGSIIGFDIDPDAVREAQENAQENRCDPAPLFLEGDYCAVSEKPSFDLLVSNIFAEVLEEVVKASLKPVEKANAREKVYILTGILEEKWDRFDEKMKEQGFSFVEKRSENPWTAGVWTMKPGVNSFHP